MRKVGIVAAALGILTLSLNATAVPPAPAPSPATAAAALTPPAIDRIARLESNVAAQAARIAALEKGAAADAARITALENLADAAGTQQLISAMGQIKKQQQHNDCVNSCMAKCPYATSSNPQEQQLNIYCKVNCPGKC